MSNGTGNYAVMGSNTSLNNGGGVRDDGCGVTDLDLAHVRVRHGDVDGHLTDGQLGLDLRHLRSDGSDGTCGSKNTLLGNGVQRGGESTEVGLQDLNIEKIVTSTHNQMENFFRTFWNMSLRFGV